MQSSRISERRAGAGTRRLLSTSAMNPQTTGWTFLSNHGHVLICLAQQPDARLRDVAELVGITERAVQSIVADLEQLGAITRTREGRRNRYELHGEVALRHPVESHCTVAELVAMACPKRRRRRG